MDFEPAIIREPTVDAVGAACPVWETILVTNLRAILDRYESDPDYHFVDTKFDLNTGADYPLGPDPETDLKSKRVIYGWMQGRGIEAMVSHANWLPECSVLSDGEKQALIARTHRLVEEVVAKMEELRARNDGRLFFTMSTEGQPLRVEDGCRVRPLERIPGSINYSDLFNAKGFFAAASLFGREDMQREAAEYLLRGVTAVEDKTFMTDQQQLNPDNKDKVAAVSGRHAHGYLMVVLGGLATAYEYTNAPSWLQRSESLFRFLFTHHLNRGQIPGLEEMDFVEFIDDENKPWVTDGDIISDTGHAIESIGLGLKLLLPMKNRPDAPASQKDLVRDCQEFLPRFIIHNFELGFDRKNGGLRKTFGLLSRKPIIDDMPWWGLPETMRAAAELLVFAPDMPQRRDILQVLADCSNALMCNYINPKVHLMSLRNRNNRGETITVIPGPSDVDPGYHTGLSIIDFMRAMRALG